MPEEVMEDLDNAIAKCVEDSGLKTIAATNYLPQNLIVTCECFFQS